MAQLVSDDVATDVGKPKRRGPKAPDTDETFVRLWKRHAEGNKSPVRQRDNQISLDLQQTWRWLQYPFAIKRSLTQRREFPRW